MDISSNQKQQSKIYNSMNNNQSIQQPWGYLIQTTNQQQTIPLINDIQILNFNEGKVYAIQNDQIKGYQRKDINDSKPNYQKSIRIIYSQNSISLQCMDENVEISLFNKKIQLGEFQQIQEGDILFISNKSGQIEQKQSFMFTINKKRDNQQEKELEKDEIAQENIYLKNKITQIKQLDENIENDLNCPICLELMYNPVTIISCLHSFCGDCLSKFISKNAFNSCCPTCRQHVDNVKQNNIISSIIEKHLKVYPELKKDQSYYKIKDSQNNFAQLQDLFNQFNQLKRLQLITQVQKNKEHEQQTFSQIICVIWLLIYIYNYIYEEKK